MTKSTISPIVVVFVTLALFCSLTAAVFAHDASTLDERGRLHPAVVTEVDSFKDILITVRMLDGSPNPGQVRAGSVLERGQQVQVRVDPQDHTVAEIAGAEDRGLVGLLTSFAAVGWLGLLICFLTSRWRKKQHHDT